ncbi:MULTISPECIES: hypothetical protein [Candidatus Protochlamydia]|uniref:Uncharacterized protein n=1 Tax=Candidatus Protochlamydia amoebophila TaxID=362787 RepID=A0A0C1HBG8_9BACT|nr:MULTISPECIES: hypothetical protein [Protochlamydia]KIC72123.1 hypothetical protein DB44_CP00010 [Candidatus Protochlamydia amoebophila]
MSASLTIRRFGYIASLLIFILGATLFYNESHTFWNSLSAAFLSSLLVLISFIMISWLVQVFTK